MFIVLACYCWKWLVEENFNALVDHSSQIYFPTWVYEQVSKGNDIIMEDATEEEKKS